VGKLTAAPAALEEAAMTREEVFERVIKILAPHAKDQAALAAAAEATHILDDLKVNSARLVDVVLAFEDEFDVEIPDEDVDSVNTIGDCVTLILAKTA
jgi:acyl carrier protein